MLRPTVIEDGVKRREKDYFWGKHKGIRATTYGGRREMREYGRKITTSIQCNRRNGNFIER